MADDPLINADPTADPAAAGDASWRDSLPDEYKSDKAIAEMEDVGALAKSYVSAREKATANGVIIPGKGASDEEFNEFYTKLGRPESADKYEMPQDGLPDSFKVDDARLKALSEKAFALGISKQQFAGLVRADAEFIHASKQQSDKVLTDQRAEWQQAVREKLGGAFEQDIGLAKGAVAQFGGDELRAIYNETGLGDHPAVVAAWAAVGRAVASDEVLGKGRGVELIPNKAQANEEILKLQADGEFMKSLERKSHPAHTLNLKKWRELHAQASPAPEEAA